MKLGDWGFLADENMQTEVVTFLREQGFNVRRALDLKLLGQPDEAVMRAAVSEDRIIVTHDSDFGRLAIATGAPFVGLLLLRPGHIDPMFTIRALERLIAADIDVSPPFIIVLHRRGNRVQIRIRQAR